MTAWMMLEMAQGILAIIGLAIGCILAWTSHYTYFRLAPQLQVQNGRLALLALMAKTDAVFLVVHSIMLYLSTRWFYEQAHGFVMRDYWDIPVARMIATGALTVAQWMRHLDRRIFWPSGAASHAE